jgi:hypothetical protein
MIITCWRCEGKGTCCACDETRQVDDRVVSTEWAWDYRHCFCQTCIRLRKMLGRKYVRVPPLRCVMIKP